MNKEQLKELVKSYFNLTEKQETIETPKSKFAEATLADGTKITNMVDGDFAVGQELHVITEEGEHVIAPSGEHTTESGIVITVDEAGQITGVKYPDEAGEGSLEDFDEMPDKGPAEMLSEEESKEDEAAKEEALEEKAKDVELAEHGDEEAMEEDEGIKKAIIEAIMTEMAPRIEELEKKFAEHEEKLAEHDEKMKKHLSSESAEKPVNEKAFSKGSKKDIKANTLNQKRYETALSRINVKSK